MGYFLQDKEDNMDNRDYDILVKLYQVGNITQTASELYLAKGAVSARIKAMEQEFGFAIVRRTDNRLSGFTRQGMEVIRFAEKYQKEFADLQKSTTQQAQEELAQRNINIAAPDSVCAHYLPQLLAQFQVTCPDAALHIRMAANESLDGLLASGEADVAFLCNGSGLSTATSLLLDVDRVVAVSQRPFALQELPGMKRVTFETDDAYVQQVNTWWRDRFRCPCKVGMHASSMNMCHKMVAGGFGYAMLPSAFLRDYPQACHTELEQKGRWVEHKTWLVYRPELATGRRVRQFVRFVQEHPYRDFFAAS